MEENIVADSSRGIGGSCVSRSTGNVGRDDRVTPAFFTTSKPSCQMRRLILQTGIFPNVSCMLFPKIAGRQLLALINNLSRFIPMMSLLKGDGKILEVTVLISFNASSPPEFIRPRIQSPSKL